MRPKLFFTIFASIVSVVILSIILLLFQKQQSVASRMDELEDAKVQVAVADQQINELHQLRRQYQQALPLSGQADKILPAAKAQSEATAVLSSITGQLGLEVNTLSFSGSTSVLPSATSLTEDAAVNGVKKMAATFSTTASYGQLQALLQRIENNQRHMQVDQINITRSDNNALNITLTVNIFSER